jgi:hypothetical protein
MKRQKAPRSKEFKALFDKYTQKEIASIAGISESAVSNIGRKGLWPRTEYSGDTSYVEKIAAYDQSFTVAGLLKKPDQGVV